MTQKIGFIGLGIMGQPMATNILKAGYELMAYNRTADKTRPIAEAGGHIAASPAELNEWADTIIMMLTGQEAIDAVIYGEKGILAAKRTGRTLVNMSTVSPAYSRTLQQCLQTADEAGAAVPAAHAAFQLYRQGVGQGHGDLDFAAVKRPLAAMSEG